MVAKWLFNYFEKNTEAEPPEVFSKKAVVLKILQYSQGEQENSCVGVSFQLRIFRNL